MYFKVPQQGFLSVGGVYMSILMFCWIVQDFFSEEEEVGQRYSEGEEQIMELQVICREGKGLEVELLWKLFVAVW